LALSKREKNQHSARRVKKKNGGRSGGGVMNLPRREKNSMGGKKGKPLKLIVEGVSACALRYG